MTEDDRQAEAELRAELIARAERLGVRIDRRWSAERIENALADFVMNDGEIGNDEADFAEDVPLPVARKLAPPPAGAVQCRITKMGDGKVFRGDDLGGCFKWGEVVHLEPDVARSLEARGFVEIGEPPK